MISRPREEIEAEIAQLEKADPELPEAWTEIRPMYGKAGVVLRLYHNDTRDETPMLRMTEDNAMWLSRALASCVQISKDDGYQ